MVVWVWDEGTGPGSDKEEGEQWWDVFSGKIDRILSPSVCTVIFVDGCYEYNINRIFRTRKEAEEDLEKELREANNDNH